MSGAAAKLHGTPAVTPAPALGGTRSRCRSDGHYVKSYGSASYDSHRAKQTPASQPPPEPLKRVASNTAGRAGDRPHPGTPPTASSPQPSSANYVDSDVDVSPLSSPSQSYVPEHRRRRATSGGPQRTPPSDTQSQTAAAAAVSTTTAATSDVRRTPPPPSRSCANGKENAPLASHAGSTVSSSPPPPPPPGNDTAAAAAPVSPPPPQQQQQQQPVREDTARTAAATTAFTRLASGYQQHQQQRRHATAPAAAPRHPPHAPATTVAVAARRGGGGGGGAGAVRGAQARSASSKARPVTATARKRPPPPPPLSSVVEPEPDAATVSPSPCRSPERDVAQEQQLAETESVLDYVASVVRAIGERRRCAAPPQAAEGFRASVVPCRRSVGHSASPDAAERGGGGGLGSPGTPYSAHRSDDDGSVALLPDIHRAAGKLLSAYTKLEYAQLGEDVDVALLEREVVEHSAQLLRLIDGVERRLSLHESSPVRHALARRRNIFRSAHELVHFIARMVHEVVLLRDLALRHDLSQAQEVWSAFRTGVEAASPPPPLPPPADDVRRGGPSLFSAAAMMRASPFLAWLEQRWFCVMRQWRQLQLEARHAAGGGDADGAVRRCRQAALRIDGLQEILRPGESISCLLHNEVERPIAEMGKTLALRRAVVAALREVLDSDAAADGTLTAADLSKALKAVQAVSSGGDAASVAAGGAEDAELVRRAEELLGRLHEAELLHRTATTTLQLAAPELVTLLEHITRANELLVLWKRAHDEAAAQAAVVAGRAALDAYRQQQQQQQQQQQALQRHSGSLSDTSRSSSSPHGDAACVCPTPTRANGGSTTAAVPWIGGGLPLAFDPHGLYAAHTPGGPWSPDLSMAYMELCEVFTAHYTQRHARRELELALTRPAAATDNRRSGHSGSLSLSPQATPRRPTRDDASPADTWRSSDGSAQPTQRLPSGPSAEELRRRLQQAEDAGVDGPLVEEARARLRRLDTLRLKIHFDAHTRVLPVTDAANADFRIVSAQIFRFCQTPQHTPAHTPPPPPSPSAPSSTGVERRLRIRYEDTDGDFISLVDQQDWRMMLSELAPHGCNGAKIELFCDYPTQPGPTSHSTTAAAADADDDVVADHRIGADSELASADVPTESAAEEGTAPAEVGGSASAAAATGERRTNVFERLATSVKSSAAAAAATGTSGASRKLRVHPHAARTTSPQRALMAAQRGRGAPHGAARTVSPQKTGGAVRRGAAAGRSKDSPPSPAANSATAELTAENLRRNAPSPQSSPRPDGAAPADSTPAEPQRSSEPAAPPAAPQPPTAAVDAAVVVDAHAVDGGACADVARESSIVHLDLDAARRWTSAGGGGDDDDLQLLEIQTRASMSTIRPERSVALSESAMSRTMRPTEMPPRAAAAPRNTFTTTHCSSKVVVVTAAAEEDEEGQPKKRVANSPSRPPRRWSTDVFSLDEVETVCSDRSRMPRHPAEPKGPASLPPRPVSSSGGGGGARTPQRGRRGARGTPTRPRPEAAAVEELRGTDRDDDDAGATSEEVLLEMQRMRDANSRAMTQRKPSWH